MSESQLRPESAVSADEDPAVRLSDRWQHGERPDVREFLRQEGELSLAQVVAILSVDQWQRWQVGDRVPAESHLQMHPQLQAGAEEAFDLVYGEFLLREELEEAPAREEYLARFPQFSVQIQRQFDLHHALESGFGKADLNSIEEPVAAPRDENTPSSVVKMGAQPPAPRAAPERDFPKLPGYEILGEIGRGGMGVVYKARHERLQRNVALKVIHKERISGNPEVVRRFQREAQAAAQLHHPNVVIVYDFDQVGDTYFLAMEYVEGVDLHELIKETGPLGIEQACDYVRQAAVGLQHASERGLVHRDIKPSNLLVTMPKKGISGFHVLPAPTEKDRPPAPKSATGQPIKPLGLSHMGTHQVGVVKILDMGLALVTYAADSASSQWTLEGTLMGTPDFIAPEQAVNSHAVDVRADLYSLGCTLYYLLTGKAPYGDYPLIKKLMMHQVGTPRPIEDLRPDIPPPVRALVGKLMAKAPAERYQTPGELIDALAGLKPPESAPAPVPAKENLAAPPAPRRKVEVPSFIPPPRPTRQPVELPPGVVKAQKVAVLEGHRGSVTSVAFSPDRSMLASGGVDGSLRLWDLAGHGPRHRAAPHAHVSDVNALAFSPDLTVLASGAGTLDALVVLWDYLGEEPHQLSNVHLRQATIDTLAFSPDRRLLAGGGSDRHVHVWDVSGSTPVSRLVLKGHSDFVKTLAFAADSQTLASGSQDGTLRLWNLSKFWSKEQAVIQGMWGPILTAAFARDGRSLAFGSLDQSVRLWDLSGPAPVAGPALKGHLGVVRLVHFNPDGTTLISACDGGRIILWDMATGEKQREWLLPRAKVYSIAVTPDGRYLATGNSDGSVYLFRLYPRHEASA